MSPSRLPVLMMLVALLGSVMVAQAQTPVDTSRPTIPQHDTWVDDSLHTIADPEDPTTVYYRTLLDLDFRPNAPGTVIHRFLAQHRATIVGGIQWLGTYTLRIPDPGTTWDATQDYLREIRADPSVKWVGFLMRSGAPGGF